MRGWKPAITFDDGTQARYYPRIHATGVHVTFPIDARPATTKSRLIPDR